MRVVVAVTRRAEDGPSFQTSPLALGYVVEQLERGQHRVMVVDVDRDGSWIACVRQARPDVVFNLAEGFHGGGRKALVPVVLDQLGLPYVFSTPAATVVGSNKWTAKVVASAAGVRCPRGALFRSPGRVRDLQAGMLIVKPVSLSNSIGISDASVVVNPAHNPRQVTAALKRVLAVDPDGALVEKFIAGRDFTVPFVEGYGASEPIEYTLRNPTRFGVLSAADKEDQHARMLSTIDTSRERRLKRELRRTTETVVGALGLRGLARVDYRVSGSSAYMIDVNVLPNLEPRCALVRSVQESFGLTPRRLFSHLVTVTKERTV